MAAVGGRRVVPRVLVPAAMTAATYPWIAAWLHCRGWARILNFESSNVHNRGRSYIQGAGPRWLAVRLAMYALRKQPWGQPDWQTVTVAETHRVSRWVWRFQLRYRRLR